MIDNWHMTEPESYSISVRLQRVSHEEGYVKVPVTEAIMQDTPEPDGSFRIDTTKMLAEAIRLGAELDNWNVEEQKITVHQIQRAPDQEFE